MIATTPASIATLTLAISVFDNAIFASVTSSFIASTSVLRLSTATWALPTSICILDKTDKSLALFISSLKELITWLAGATKPFALTICESEISFIASTGALTLLDAVWTLTISSFRATISAELNAVLTVVSRETTASFAAFIFASETIFVIALTSVLTLPNAAWTAVICVANEVKRSVSDNLLASVDKVFGKKSNNDETEG